VAISAIRVGDELLAWDEVTATWTHTGPLVLELALDDGSTVETTPGHPFYVIGSGWTAAGEVTVGSLLASSDGNPARVTAVSGSGGPAEMGPHRGRGAHVLRGRGGRAGAQHVWGR
jgi:hypothetical protein